MSYVNIISQAQQIFDKNYFSFVYIYIYIYRPIIKRFQFIQTSVPVTDIHACIRFASLKYEKKFNFYYTSITVTLSYVYVYPRVLLWRTNRVIVANHRVCRCILFLLFYFLFCILLGRRVQVYNYV